MKILPAYKVGGLIWAARVLTTALSLVIVGASIFRSEGWYLQDIWRLQEAFGGDKAFHCFAGATLMAMLACWWQLWLSYRAIIIFTVGLLALVLLDELSQQFLARREFSWLDYLSSSIGILSVSLICLWRRYLSVSIQQRRLHLSA